MGKPNKVMDKFNLPEKFRNVEAVSFGTPRDGLVISFHGFEDKNDMMDFCSFLFSRINMSYNSFQTPPTIH